MSDKIKASDFEKEINGPWEAQYKRDAVVTRIVEDSGRNVCLVDSDCLSAHSLLITAAPELLELLGELRDQVINCPTMLVKDMLLDIEGTMNKSEALIERIRGTAKDEDGGMTMAKNRRKLFIGRWGEVAVAETAQLAVDYLNEDLDNKGEDKREADFFEEAKPDSMHHLCTELTTAQWLRVLTEPQFWNCGDGEASIFYPNSPDKHAEGSLEC